MAKRSVQEINASSMADIAFLLLIFFLVTTTMSVDKGLSRRLPPHKPEKQENKDVEINERNIFVVRINSTNEVFAQGKEYRNVADLREDVKKFILNEGNDPTLPELHPLSVEIDGRMEEVMTTTDHLISLGNDRGTEYQKYIEVQNELVAAYNEVRDEYARKRWATPYAELTEERQSAIQKIFPQKISEAEPKNYGGNK